MSDIPPECIWEILTRVPTEPLLQFRCVCKAWRSIIDDAEFIKSHTLHQIESTRLIIRNDYGTRLHTLSVDSLYNSETKIKKVCAAPIKTITHHGISRLPQLPVSSCHGLILIPHCIEKRMWVLWNHFTGEFRKLPLYVTSKGCGMHGCGLGYDSVSDDYKVVGIAPLLDGETSETLVYSLKSNSWRRILDFPGKLQFLWGDNVVSGFFLNGALHWFSYKQEEMQIIALDLGTENFRVLSMPSALRGLDLRFRCKLDVLGGSLFMSRCYPVKHVDSVWRVEIWIMNEYGKKDSWTKMLSFPKRLVNDSLGLIGPMAYLKNKGLILIQHKDNEFFWFDVKKQNAKRVEIGGAPNYFSSQVFPASLFQLNTNAGADGGFAAKGTAKRKRKRTDDRLNLTLTFSGSSGSTD